MLNLFYLLFAVIKLQLTRNFLLCVYFDKLIFNTLFYKQFNVIISSILEKNVVQTFANQSRSNSNKLERSGNFGSQFRAGSCLSCNYNRVINILQHRGLQGCRQCRLDAAAQLLKCITSHRLGYQAGYLDLRHN